MSEQRDLFGEPEASAAAPPPVEPTPAPAEARKLAGIGVGDRVAIVGTDPLVVLTVTHASKHRVGTTQPDRAFPREWRRDTGREIGSGVRVNVPEIRPATARVVNS